MLPFSELLVLAHSCSPGALMPMSSYFPFISYSINSFIPISLGLLPIKHGAPCWKCQAEPDPLHVFQECTVQRDEASMCTGSKHSPLWEVLWLKYGQSIKANRAGASMTNEWLTCNNIHHYELKAETFLKSTHCSVLDFVFSLLVIHVGKCVFHRQGGQGTCSWRYWLCYSARPEKNEHWRYKAYTSTYPNGELFLDNCYFKSIYILRHHLRTCL